VILAGLALSFVFHLVLSGSSLHIPPDKWLATLDVHLHSRPFYIRPFQSYTTLALASVSGMTPRDAFFVIQYLLAGLTTYLFYRYLRLLGFDRIWGHIGLGFFLLSFPVLAAYFAPVHTWDDFWLYFFLIALSLTLLKHQWPATALLYFLACIAREAALFFLPVLLYMAWCNRRETRPVKLMICLTLPVLAYSVYYSLFDDVHAPATWQMLEHNFANAQTAADAVVSLINAFGWLLPAAIVGLVLLLKRHRTPEQQFLVIGFILFWPINTAAATALAMVRETRLLFPPFLFVIPLALYAVREVWARGLCRLHRQQLAGLGLIVLCLGASGIWFGYALHPIFAYGANSVLRRDYASLSAGLTAAFLIIWFLARHQHKKAAPETGAA